MKPHLTSNTRALAAECLYLVVDKGHSLNESLPAAQQKLKHPKDKALLQSLCYGVLRWLPKLDFASSKLLKKPLKGKQRVFQFLLYVGFYQLAEMRIPAHAAVGETVNALDAMRADGLKSLINGVLRNFQRQQDEIWQQAAENPVLQYAHPKWIVTTLQETYPNDWQSILEQNQIQAPMWLRVNAMQYSTKEYSKLLTEAGIAHSTLNSAPQALKLDKPIDVFRLPHFATGSCSVQDAAAQHAALFLDLSPNQKVLDACAAPGGKTCHSLELANNELDMTAIDADENRLVRVHENLTRLQLTSKVVCGDASKPDDWHEGELYDRILCDAPCSATGVIRRHPDIKWLRRKTDIEDLATLQGEILNALWKKLKPGGILLYATCSIMPQENVEQVKSFLANNNDANLVPLSKTETTENPGWQILPGQNSMDGFYYAKLQKAV